MYQTKALGSKTLYIPGEGEPFLDKAFWDVIRYAKLLSMDVIIFTNGLILSNDRLSLKEWGVHGEDILRTLKEYPVYIYHKLWSLDQERVSDMMGVPLDACEYVNFDYGMSTISSVRILLRHQELYRTTSSCREIHRAFGV